MYNYFTNHADTDFYFLHQLDDENLYNICQTNLHYKNICYNNLNLRHRIHYYLKTINEIKLYVNNIINKVIDNNEFIQFIFTDEDLKSILPNYLTKYANHAKHQIVTFDFNNYDDDNEEVNEIIMLTTINERNEKHTIIMNSTYNNMVNIMIEIIYHYPKTQIIYNSL